MAFDEIGILYLDGGTTRTRAWVAMGERVVASAEVPIGARDSARERGSAHLAEAVRRLVADVRAQCRARGHPAPLLGVAAGMITSGQGLVEVPHVEAPAGAVDLARGAVCHALAEAGSLPIVFVPGVRTGPPRSAREAVGEADVMRGEEALALGLARTGRLAGGGVLLTLGSHWKAIRVDGEGRIEGSVSTLSGELIHAVSAHTILAGSLPRDWPAALPPDWVASGLREGRRDGLPRALYEVRLLDQCVPSAPDERLAFLVGATMAASEDTLLPPATSGPVVLAGVPALVAAWEPVIRARGREPIALGGEETSAAFRAGCRAVLAAGRLTSSGAASAAWSGPPAPPGPHEG